MTSVDRSIRLPFEVVGGAVGVRRVVDRFYDLMDTMPAYHALRVLHADNLEPMRQSLTGFLTAWLGGARDWFEDNPGKCMMSVHAPIVIDEIVADLWVAAMTEAMRDNVIDAALADHIGAAFKQMANNMIRR